MPYDRAFRAGQTFEQFLHGVGTNRAMWDAMARRTYAVGPAAASIAATPGSWRLLALADDWCGDAVNTLPVIAQLARAAGIPLRIVPRDAHPELRDHHLTGGSRSVPVVILLDGPGQPRGWWGPRPRVLQEWFVRAGRALEKGERYRELRRWYARDRGVTTATEIADLVECGAAEDGPRYEGTSPCTARAAA
jgi:arginase family enzyme